MNILTLDEVKNFLRVDYTEDDTQIQLLISNAENYLRDSIDDFDYKITNDVEGRFTNKAKLVMLTLITNWYDNRDFTAMKTTERVRCTISSIINQMQYCYAGDISE